MEVLANIYLSLEINFYCFEPLNEFYQKFYLTNKNKLKIYNFALSNKTTKIKIPII